MVPFYAMRRVPDCRLLCALFAFGALSFGVFGSNVVNAEPAHSAADSAATDRARARDAYDRATRAYDKGDYVTAAREYADADLIAPTNASLEAALEAAIRADDPAEGQELVERAQTRTLDKSTTATVSSARARFANRATRITTDCAAATSCILSVDGVAKDPTRVLFVAHGPHTFVLQRDDERFERLVDVRGEALAFSPKPNDATSSSAAETSPATGTTGPSNPPTPAKDDSKTKPADNRLSPIVFYGAAGLTVVAAGLTAASAFDTQSRHDKFHTLGCDSGAGQINVNCGAISSDGKSAELRTNIGLGVTGALALTSAALAIFFVHWQKDETRVSIGARPGGAVAELIFP